MRAMAPLNTQGWKRRSDSSLPFFKYTDLYMLIFFVCFYKFIIARLPKLGQRLIEVDAGPGIGGGVELLLGVELVALPVGSCSRLEMRSWKMLA